MRLALGTVLAIFTMIGLWTPLAGVLVVEAKVPIAFLYLGIQRQLFIGGSRSYARNAWPGDSRSTGSSLGD
jgi:hypothetical protein